MEAQGQENEQGYSLNKSTEILQNENRAKLAKNIGERRAEDMWRMTKEILKKYINSDESILDVGTGLGQTTRVFAEKLGLDFKRVFSLDIGNILQEEKLKPGYSLAKGEALPYKNEVVDAVLLTDMLHHLEEEKTHNQRMVIEEAIRITKQGGHVVVIENLLRSDLSEEENETYKKRLFWFDNTFNSLEESQNPHSNRSLEDWKALMISLELKFEESVQWQWGYLDFIPGLANLGSREKYSKYFRPFTDSVMVFSKIAGADKEFMGGN